jgi:hypothetical protein
VGKRSRKRPSRPPAPERRDTNGTQPAKKLSRSEAKDAAARAALVPLAEGERPRAVTVGAVLAGLFAVGNLIAYAAGIEINGERPQAGGVIAYSLLMGVAAWGMWRSKYWAVLGLQAILGILIVIFSLFLFEAENLKSGLICVAVIAPAGLLFFHLVKAMARIQMPDRRPSS